MFEAVAGRRSRITEPMDLAHDQFIHVWIIIGIVTGLAVTRKAGLCTGWLTDCRNRSTRPAPVILEPAVANRHEQAIIPIDIWYFVYQSTTHMRLSSKVCTAARVLEPGAQLVLLRAIDESGGSDEGWRDSEDERHEDSQYSAA